MHTIKGLGQIVNNQETGYQINHKHLYKSHDFLISQNSQYTHAWLLLVSANGWLYEWLPYLSLISIVFLPCSIFCWYIAVSIAERGLQKPIQLGLLELVFVKSCFQAFSYRFVFERPFNLFRTYFTILPIHKCQNSLTRFSSKFGPQL